MPIINIGLNPHLQLYREDDQLASVLSLVLPVRNDCIISWKIDAILVSSKLLSDQLLVVIKST